MMNVSIEKSNILRLFTHMLRNQAHSEVPSRISVAFIINFVSELYTRIMPNLEWKK